MATMAAASSQSCSKPDTMAAPNNTQMMTLVNWDRNNFTREGEGASGSSLNPSRLWRRCASSPLRPPLRSVESAAATSCGDSVCHECEGVIDIGAINAADPAPSHPFGCNRRLDFLCEEVVERRQNDQSQRG